VLVLVVPVLACVASKIIRAETTLEATDSDPRLQATISLTECGRSPRRQVSQYPAPFILQLDELAGGVEAFADHFPRRINAEFATAGDFAHDGIQPLLFAIILKIQTP